MTNRVELKISKKLTNLAGYDYGLQTYTEQIKDFIDIKEPFEIVFPNHIKGVASSFVQGFFSEIVENIGFKGVEQNVKISAANEQLETSILGKLY